MEPRATTEFLIIGSGFGGAFAALELAKAGREVLIVERGVWPDRDESCWDENQLHFPTPKYRGQTPVLSDQGDGSQEEIWPEDMVGGMSTIYGAAALRMREEDFLGTPSVDSGERDERAAWPFPYEELEPFYAEAERIQNVSGVAGEDITEPERSSPFPQEPPKLSEPSKRIWRAAESLGLHPTRIPLAINFDGRSPGQKCVLCDTCDKYLCQIEAKNDVTVVCLPQAMSLGATILPDTRAIRIKTSGERAVSALVVHQSSGERQEIRAQAIILAGGALSTPHLLLSSGIRSAGGGADLLGRGLMRHANSVVAGLSPTRVNPGRKLYKHLWIPDFYHGHPLRREKPDGPWGMIQQVHIPGKRMIQASCPPGLKTVAGMSRPFLLGLLIICEDVRQESNRVCLDDKRTDKFGQPVLRVFHRYAPRDMAARRALDREARKILRRAGVLPIYTLSVETFSHVFGTCRFGKDPASSVLDPNCRVWGLKNLYVTDASCMPSGGSVNPSLTIAANAIRAARAMINP
jgi:choline dehydrogenase-like flavoprotein